MINLINVTNMTINMTNLTNMTNMIINMTNMTNKCCLLICKYLIVIIYNSIE